MATDDVQRLVTGSASAPATFKVPGNGQMRPKSVFASFDGTGAAGAFKPALKITSDAGELVGIYPTDDQVAAGGSAQVSWFPHLAAAAAAPTPSSTGLPIAAAYSDPSGVTVASGAINTYVSLQDGVSAAGFSTTDSTTFANLSSTLFTGSAVYGIGIQAAGTYAVFNNSFDLSGGTAGRVVNAYWAASNGSAPSFFQQGRSQNVNVETWDRGQAGQGPHMFLHEWMTVSVGQTPAVLVPYGKVASGGNITASFQMMVVQLSTSVLSKL